MNKFTKSDYENAAKASLSYAGMCRYLGISPRGGNYTTLKNKIEKYNIDISHFLGKGWNIGMKVNNRKTYSLNEILQKDFPYNTQKLKNRLIESGIKEKKCECCKNTEWNGKEIPLELHHINGDRNDNRIENLMILCPNCHAQTEKYRGKNKIVYLKKEVKSDVDLKEEYDNKKEKKYCKHCGKELTKWQKKYCCQKCSHETTSKKPPIQEINEKLKEFNGNLSAVGRFYGVSDNAVRKWINK